MDKLENFADNKRIVRRDRCGGTEEGAPEALLTEDYLCEKCAAALARRGTYLEYSGV